MLVRDARVSTEGETSSPSDVTTKPARPVAPGAKLAPTLRGLAGQKAGTAVIQIWVSSIPKDGLAKLKALGFELADVLTPGKLLIGTAPAEKLKALAALVWVLYIEPPKFK